MRKISWEEKPWLYPLAGLILIWLPFIIRAVNGQTALAGLLEYDIGFQWIPFKAFTRFCYQNGYFPLWCPYVFAGMPFLAFSHTQVLYPFGFLLTFFDYARAVNFFYPIHLSIGFLGLYLLLRNLSLRAFPSFLASLGMILSGKFFYFIHFLPSASSNFWGVWFFYFLVKFARKEKINYLLGASFSLGLQFLGGDFESSAYQLFFAPFFLLFLWSREKRFNPKLWLGFFFSIFLGLALAGAQFLPLFEYSGFFLRKVGYTFSGFEWRIHPIKISWGLIFPLEELHTIETKSLASYLYLGLLGIFFPIYAATRERKWLGLFILSLIILLFSFGSLRFLDWVVYHLPLLNRFGAQEHSFFLFQIFWAILIGAGLERALKDNRGIFFFFIFSLALVMFGEIYFKNLGYRKILLIILFLGSLISLRNKTAFLLTPGLVLVVFLLDIYLPALKYLPKNPPEIYQLPMELNRFRLGQKSPSRAVIISRQGINDPILLHHLGLRIHLGTIDGWITTPPLTYAKFLNLIEPRSVIFKDGKINSYDFNHFRRGEFIRAETLPLIDLLSLRYFLVRGKNLKFASPYIFRADEQSKIAEQDISLPPNSYFQQKVYIEKGDIFKTKTPLQKSSPFFLLLFQNSKTSSLLYARAPLQPKNSKKPNYLKISLPLKSPQGKTGIFLFLNLSISSFEKKLELGEPRIENSQKRIQKIWSNEFEIYENRKAFPMAYMVHNCEVFDDQEQILARLKNSYRWELERKIYLSASSPTARVIQKVAEELKNRGIDPLELKEPVYLKTNLPDRVVFLVRLLRPGYLFLNHQYLPGWKVFVDGREWRIERADYCFRAVFLDKGTHRVEFRYQPVGFAIGLYFSFASFLVQLIFLGLWIKKDRGKIRGL